ncbi:MAG: helix-turn-helix transcriptional regulator [Lawsonibacter sp.]|nr:helix-turn-helix transcriptional regulator [Lawsonibacter sp.]
MDSEFSRRLRKLRAQKGVSQQVAADFCQLSKTTVANYEQGKRIPSLETAAVLADYFGVPLDYLCGRKKN